jgi:hypothetical protein
VPELNKGKTHDSSSLRWTSPYFDSQFPSPSCDWDTSPARSEFGPKSLHTNSQPVFGSHREFISRARSKYEIKIMEESINQAIGSLNACPTDVSLAEHSLSPAVGTVSTLSSQHSFPQRLRSVSALVLPKPELYMCNNSCLSTNNIFSKLWVVIFNNLVDQNNYATCCKYKNSNFKVKYEVVTGTF